MKYLLYSQLICFLFLTMGCNREVDGCKDSLALNTNSKATNHCCCVYDVDKYIDIVTSKKNYFINDVCGESDNGFGYSIEIDALNAYNKAIVINNFANLDIAVTAYWEKELTFSFDEKFIVGECTLQILGLIDIHGAKIYIDYSIDVTSNNCFEVNDYTCTVIY